MSATPRVLTWWKNQTRTETAPAATNILIHAGGRARVTYENTMPHTASAPAMTAESRDISP